MPETGQTRTELAAARTVSSGSGLDAGVRSPGSSAAAVTAESSACAAGLIGLLLSGADGTVVVVATESVSSFREFFSEIALLTKI